MTREKTIEYFQVFYETSKTILSSSSLQEILLNLVKQTVHALDAKGASLRLIDEDTNCLELASSYQLSERYLGKGPLNADKSIPEVLQGRVIVIKDADKDPRIQYREEKRQEGINTLLAVPVIAGERVIGVMRIYSAEPRDFDAEEIEFVSALAEMGGLAIANARLHEKEGGKLLALFQEMGIERPEPTGGQAQEFKGFTAPNLDEEKSLKLFRTLHEVTRALLSSIDSQEVMDMIIDKVLELFGVKGSALRIIDETTREMELLAGKGLSDTFLQKGPLHADYSIQQTLEGNPVLVLDAQKDPRIEYPEAMTREGIVSILSLPILAGERVIGLLRLYSATERNFAPCEVAFLSAMAEIAGLLIMNAKLYENTRNDLSFWTATRDYMEA